MLVKDILAILDKIPVWKQLKELPMRVDALEKRLAEIENMQQPTGDRCPRCKREAFVLISTKPHPQLGRVGVHIRQYRCSSCSFEESKTVET